MSNEVIAFDRSLVIKAGAGLALGYVTRGLAWISVDGETFEALAGRWFSVPARETFSVSGNAQGVCVWYPDAVGVFAIGAAKRPGNAEAVLLSPAFPDERARFAAIAIVRDPKHWAGDDADASVHTLQVEDGILCFSSVFP
jgi:hypothetical protein